MIKKLLFVSAIIITIYSCNSTKDTTSGEKPEAPTQPNTIERDAKGNYYR
jgi:hypothetical protein